MRSNLATDATLWCDAFFDSIRKHIRSQCAGRDGEEFSVLISVIFLELLNERDRAIGPYGGLQWHIRQNSERLGLSRKTVTRHLKALARAGIIKCVVARTISKQLPLEVIINHKLLEIIGKRSNLTTARQLARVCAQLWLERGDLVNADVQGWDHESTTPFGRATGPRIDSRRDTKPTEPTNSESDQNGTEGQQSPSQSVAEIVNSYCEQNPEREQRETKVQRLKRERADYRRQVDGWVDGAAKAWTHFQSIRGVTIPEGPSWAAADKGSLPKQVAGERRELEKLVAMYGGRRLAVAWIVFISGHMIPDKKDADRPAFIPDRAPWQFTTPDKRPSHFSKHINLILEHAQKLDWEADGKFVGYLGEKFGSALDVAPQAKMYSTRPITADKNLNRGA